jgi:hypothetical protein
MTKVQGPFRPSVPACLAPRWILACGAALFPLSAAAQTSAPAPAATGSPEAPPPIGVDAVLTF